MEFIASLVKNASILGKSSLTTRANNASGKNRTFVPAWVIGRIGTKRHMGGFLVRHGRSLRLVCLTQLLNGCPSTGYQQIVHLPTAKENKNTGLETSFLIFLLFTLSLCWSPKSKARLRKCRNACQCDGSARRSLNRGSPSTLAAPESGRERWLLARARKSRRNLPPVCMPSTTSGQRPELQNSRYVHSLTSAKDVVCNSSTSFKGRCVLQHALVGAPLKQNETRLLLEQRSCEFSWLAREICL